MARSTDYFAELAHRLLARTLFSSILLALALAAPAQAVPSITLATGVTNPAASLQTTGLATPETAIADTAAVVAVGDYSALLQATLNAQGFTSANHWSLVTDALPLADTATFNITQYNLFLNGAGTKFGETMKFELSPTPAAPTAAPGQVVTEHWLQILHEDQQYAGFGFAITGQQGFWQFDNGDVVGGAAAGAETGGPYYDSNSTDPFSVPPTFHDSPQHYSGAGSYLHFVAFPAWDIYTPAVGPAVASEAIYVGSHGISWGFSIVPEPSTFLLVAIGLGGMAYRRRCRAEA